MSRMCLVVGTLLATKTDGILDLVADGLAVGVLVLGAAELVSGLLGAGLLAVGLDGAGGLSIIRKASLEAREVELTLSAVSVTPSLTLSVVLLELWGVAFSWSLSETVHN